METFEALVLAGMVIIMVEILLLIWIVGTGVDEFLALLKEDEKEKEHWVLDRNQQPRRVRKPPTYSRPSDLSDPQMGEGRHG